MGRNTMETRMSDDDRLSSETRITVTGGGGFLGRSVVTKLHDAGFHDVFVPRSAEFDLREKDAIQSMLDHARPEVLIHLAATVGGIGANRESPGRFFYDNAIMGIQLIESARRFGVKKFVCVGTICAYPKLAPVPFREDDLWNGYPEEVTGPYGLAKKMLLVQLQSYRHQYGFNGIYLLPVNLYGPGDNFDPEHSHVAAALIRRFVEAKRHGTSEVVAWGTGTASREFLYVDDAAEGIVRATELYDSLEPVNLGTGDEITIKGLVYKIKELVGYDGKVVWDTSKPDGQPRRKLDVTRARQEFGFEAKMPLPEGLKATIRWYQDRSGALPASNPVTSSAP